MKPSLSFDALTLHAVVDELRERFAGGRIQKVGLVDEWTLVLELYGKVFKPTVHKEIYPFEDLGRCFEEMHQNVQTGIPIIRIAAEMPSTVKALVP